GVNYDVVVIFQLKKRVLSFVSFAFPVKDNHQHSVHGFAPFLFVLSRNSSSVLSKQSKRQFVSPSKRSGSRLTEPRSLREFAKSAKTYIGFLRKRSPARRP